MKEKVWDSIKMQLRSSWWHPFHLLSSLCWALLSRCGDCAALMLMSEWLCGPASDMEMSE